MGAPRMTSWRWMLVVAVFAVAFWGGAFVIGPELQRQRPAAQGNLRVAAVYKREADGWLDLARKCESAARSEEQKLAQLRSLDVTVQPRYFPARIEACERNLSRYRRTAATARSEVARCEDLRAEFEAAALHNAETVVQGSPFDFEPELP